VFGSFSYFLLRTGRRLSAVFVPPTSGCTAMLSVRPQLAGSFTSGGICIRRTSRPLVGIQRHCQEKHREPAARIGEKARKSAPKTRKTSSGKSLNCSSTSRNNETFLSVCLHIRTRICLNLTFANTPTNITLGGSGPHREGA